MASCVQDKNNDVISSFKKNSQLVSVSFTPEDDASSCTLPTYHHKNFGDVAYVELSEFFKAISIAGGGLIPSTTKVSREGNNIFEVSNHNIVAYRFDASNDTLTIKRDDIIQRNVMNNGIAPDFATPNGDVDSCVHPSIDSKYVVEPVDQICDLKPYNIDLAEQEEKLYLPLPFISSLVFKNDPMDLLYNGLDFYISAYIGPDKTMLLASNASYYSNKKEFTMLNKTYKEYPVVGDEVYRYAVEKESGDFSVLSFKKDGTVIALTASSVTEPGTLDPEGLQMEYETKDDGIYVSAFMDFPDMGKQNIGTFKIPFENSYFATKVRSNDVAKYSYNQLRFIFDNFYGLPDDLYARYNVENIEDLINKKGFKKDLLSTDSVTYDNALATLTMTYVDDCHTKYSGCSIYSGFENDPTKINNEHRGERRKTLGEHMDDYKALRTQVMTAIDQKYEDESIQQGLFFEGNTAVLRFDGFNITSNMINRTEDVDLNIENISAVLGASSPDGFYSAFKEIERHSEVENVVIDLTINGGGAAITLPYLAAFFTDDPTFILKNSKTGAISEFHYEVDLNRNGIFGEPQDTYKDRYNIFLLTSDFSFSCGNALPTMARIAGVKIIGKQSGGGACAVTSYSDGCGSLFNTSNQFQISYQDPNGNYIHNDSGIPVDYELDKESWYDLPALNAFINTLD